MTIILGIDPGSRMTGYGVIEVKGNHSRYISAGTLYVIEVNVASRLKNIFLGIKEIIHTFQPHEVSIEEVFMHRNPNSAIKLGQARGAAIVAAAEQDLPVFEYSARSVKQAVVGYGAAKKEQMQHMVKMLLNLQHVPAEDAADGLAIALCHAHSRSLNALMADVIK